MGMLIRPTDTPIVRNIRPPVNHPTEADPEPIGQPRTRTSTRVLLAPVTITPTKPLTPSHVKFLLWMDVMERATALISEVTVVHRHRTFAVTRQVTDFWEHLDRNHPGLDVTGLSDVEIGRLYVESHVEGRYVDATALRRYAHRVEHQGWLHPATVRMLDVWQEQLGVIGLVRPDLGREGSSSTQHASSILTAERVLELLREKNLCLDMREWGGPVFLDASAHGMPLRQVIDAEGRANYLLCALRELLPLATEPDQLLLACDAELGPDYRLLARLLEQFGAATALTEVSRIPIEGARQSARHGGWEGVTLGALIEQLEPRFERAAIRLGLRLYFVAVAGKGDAQSFDLSHLFRQVERSRRMIVDAGLDPDAGPTPGAEPESVAGLELRAEIARLARDGIVDPYRLTSALLSRNCRLPLQSLLPAVYL